MTGPVIALLALAFAAAGLWLIRAAPGIVDRARALREGGSFRLPRWSASPGFRRVEIGAYRLLGGLWVAGGVAIALFVLFTPTQPAL